MDALGSGKQTQVPLKTSQRLFKNTTTLLGGLVLGAPSINFAEVGKMSRQLYCRLVPLSRRAHRAFCFYFFYFIFKPLLSFLLSLVCVYATNCRKQHPPPANRLAKGDDDSFGGVCVSRFLLPPDISQITFCHAMYAWCG